MPKKIERGDYVLAHAGHFQGKRGYVSLMSDHAACVVFKKVWAFGIHVEQQNLTVTKKGRLSDR